MCTVHTFIKIKIHDCMCFHIYCTVYDHLIQIHNRVVVVIFLRFAFGTQAPFVCGSRPITTYSHCKIVKNVYTESFLLFLYILPATECGMEQNATTIKKNILKNSSKAYTYICSKHKNHTAPWFCIL